MRIKRNALTAAAALLFAVVLGRAEAQPQSGCTNPECFQATEWHRGYTAILIESADPAAGRNARDFVEAAGGRVAIITSNVLLGWVPAKLDRALIGKDGIVRILRAPFDPKSARFERGTFRARQSEIAIDFFNAVTSGALSAQVDRGSGVRGLPLNNDVIHADARPGATTASVVIGPKRLHPSTQNFSGPPWTNEQMIGTVNVNVFEIESDGSIDANEFTWTNSDFSSVTNQALAGLSFWSSQAGNYGHSVSFGIGVWEPYNAPCNQGYEPIRHSSGDDYLWINEVMRKFQPPYLGGRVGGYGASPVTYTNVFNMVEQFNYDQEHLPGYGSYNWGFTVFVAYNPPGAAPSTFTNGYFAYTTAYGGPWVQMLFNNDGWGTNNFNRIMTHETGHVFWACDEYYQAGYGGCTTCANCRGYGPRLSATNRNCANPSTSCPINTTCMMKSNDFALCPDTPGQIGW